MRFSLGRLLSLTRRRAHSQPPEFRHDNATGSSGLSCMSPPAQDGETHRLRARANTNSTFPSFSWRRGRDSNANTPGVAASPSHPQSLPISIDELLTNLTPPAVPSLATARALGVALSSPSAPENITAVVNTASLTPILTALCAPDVPPQLRSAGYEILAGYMGMSGSHGVHPLSTSDKLTFFSLFKDASSTSWAPEVWEARFKAMKHVVKCGEDMVGLEVLIIGVLEEWIEAAFGGILVGDGVSSLDRMERERCLETLSSFLTDMMSRGDVLARLSDEEVSRVLAFFTCLATRALSLPPDLLGPSGHPSQAPSPSQTTPTRMSHSHRRHPSSISAPLNSPTGMTPTSAPRRPLDVVIPIYVTHLSTQIRILSSAHLQTILPVLFRSLAFYSSHLPRLSITNTDHFEHPLPLESKIVDTLDSLMSGPYSANCFVILKQHLLPPVSPSSHPTTSAPASPTVHTPSPHPHSFSSRPTDRRTAIQAATGATRVLRLSIRRALCSRLARSYIARVSADSYTPSGAPGHIDLENDLMERAWARDEVTKGDLGKVGRVLKRATEAWVALKSDGDEVIEGMNVLTEEADQRGDLQREDVLMEVVGVLKDVFQEYDERSEGDEVDEDEGGVVGEILQALCGYIALLKEQDGSPFILPLSQASEARSPLLRELCGLLSRDPSPAPCTPSIPTLLLLHSSHLSDNDTARLIATMHDRSELYPVTLTWSSNWSLILSNPDETCLCSLSTRPHTRRVMLDALQETIDVVRDVPRQREVLVDLVLQYWKKLDVKRGEMDGGEVIWKVLADEVVFRQVENQEDPDDTSDAKVATFIDEVLELMKTSATEGEDADINSGTVGFSIPIPYSPPPPSDHQSPASGPSASVTPVLSRVQSTDIIASSPKDKDAPNLMSLISSFTSPVRGQTHSQGMPPPPLPPSSSTPLSILHPDDAASVNSMPLPNVPEGVTTPSLSGSVGAVVALLHIFGQFAFTPYALSDPNRLLAVRVFQTLVALLTTAQSSHARLTVLQFMFRLRVDRDHRLFSSYARYDRFEHISTLAGLIGRYTSPEAAQFPENGPTGEDIPPDIPEAFKTRARPPERDDRRSSRGRDAKASHSRSSRSRSRAATRARPPTVPLTDASTVAYKAKKPIWRIPERLPFSVPESDTPSDGLISYDPDGPGNRVVLPISKLLHAFIDILQEERDWEILSYVLCHLPTMLANKHLFCGPNSRQAIARLTDMLCTRLSTGELASSVAYWPPGLKPRDAHGLAYHTLSILISYRKCYEFSKQHVLVEVLMAGLSGQQSTIKCCLHALSLSAFELSESTRRFLPDILTKLSQIMTNATIAVHIIDFLAVVGSLPALYANFTEAHFRLVFGVTLRYLQLHNQPDESSPNTSWALSQHVRIMSYYILYLWFLAVKLPDRPKHVRYIVRQLLLANEGQSDIDEFAEVCFDWLARYAYSSADPRPADSMLKDMVMNPATQRPESEVASEKTWLVGSALVTIRTLTRIGWIEVIARRASGLTRILARVENLPMVGPGEVDPDMISLPAALAMDRAVPGDDGLTGERKQEAEEERKLYEEVLQTLYPGTREDGDNSKTEDNAARPDPITGYVWQGQAPSQRRKEVAIDPSYFALQLSPYPDNYESKRRSRIVDPNASGLSSFIRILDRTPVIDTHKVGVMYVAPGQTDEIAILANKHGSPAYSRFLEGLGRLITLRGQKDVYVGGLDPDEDGEYAYAWWDDIGQVLYHTATLMPSHPSDPRCNLKKRHIGNDYVCIVWNDSGQPYKFDTLQTQFNFVNIVIEPHSLGAIAAFSNNLHENEYFRVTLQRAPGVTEFAPIGNFKLISAENLPLLVRQLSLLADWFAVVFQATKQDTERIEVPTNWRTRLQAIKRFKAQQPVHEPQPPVEGVMGQESFRDFTIAF